MELNGQQAAGFALLLLVLTACSGGGGASPPDTSSADVSAEDVPTLPAPGSPSMPGNPPSTEPGDPESPGSALAGKENPETQPDVTPPDTDSPVPPPRPVVTPPAVAALEDGGTLLNDFPSLLFVDTLADSGLHIGYTIDDQRERTDTAFIAEQWDYMQRCLGETGAPPLIVLVDGSVSPLTRDDDVLRFIDGSEIATASVSLSGTVIQISEGDFDGTFGVPGFNLRQIIGRSLWSVAALPERDYPTTCARVISPYE